MATAGVMALRYAHAFAEVVASEGLSAADAQKQLKDFAELLSGNGELREVLEDPSIPSDQKLAVIDSLAERLGLLRAVRNFIAVIMDHDRLSELNEILAAYDRVADTAKGIVDVEVTSSHGVVEDDRELLEAQIARIAGSKVRVTYVQDKTLLGGAIVKIGSTVYDGSVRGQLDQLKQTLVEA
jgi:F-type H+-transporting ATPase subunit delta